MAIVIEGYLTERKLATALQQIVADSWAGGQVVLPGSRRRWDMAYKHDSSLVLVEYDGDEHYRDSLKIKSDLEKDHFAQNNRMLLVRFPYWVQLDNATLQHYFRFSGDVRQTFPHGFITTRLFPASFCELGIERFRRELHALPPHVRAAVIGSLHNRIREHGLEYVLPSSLRDLALQHSPKQ